MCSADLVPPDPGPYACYGEMYGTHLSALALTTAGNWYLLPGLTEGEKLNVSFVVGAEDSHATPSVAGLFLLNIHAALFTGVGVVLHMGVFLNGTLVAKLQTSLTGDAAEEAFSVTGLIALAVDDDLDVRFSGDTDGVSVTVKHLDFNIVQIG